MRGRVCLLSFLRCRSSPVTIDVVSRARSRIVELFSDCVLIAVNKPAGVSVIPERYRKDRSSIRETLEQSHNRLWTVHRIDRDTSGIVLFAKDRDTHRLLSVAFAQRTVAKTYHALVVGMPRWSEIVADSPLLVDGDARHRTLIDTARGKPSRTSFKVMERFSCCSLLEIVPTTGRTHQIRAHAAHIGHPIVADPLYGDGRPLFLSSFKYGYRKGAGPESALLDRLALHALCLCFVHPQTGEQSTLRAPYPKDFSAALNQLGKHASPSGRG